MNQLVFIENQQVVTDSLTIAEMFGKEHFNVLQDIKKQMEYAGEEFGALNFQVSSYRSKQNKEMPKYNLTEEAFTLVVFSYNTKEAVQTKIKFIQEFKRMREYIEQQQKVNFTMPTTPLEALQHAIGQMVEQEKRLGAVEQKQQQLEKQHDNITEIISLNPTEWRKKVNAILNKIGQSRGGFGEYQKVRQESYEKLEERAKCKLEIRLRNRIREAREQGIMTKAQIGKLSKLDVIAGDARLTEIYLAIVKEMAIANKIDFLEQ